MAAAFGPSALVARVLFLLCDRGLLIDNAFASFLSFHAGAPRIQSRGLRPAPARRRERPRSSDPQARTRPFTDNRNIPL